MSALYGSKIRVRFSGGTPGPSSLTAMCASLRISFAGLVVYGRRWATRLLCPRPRGDNNTPRTLLPRCPDPAYLPGIMIG
jgi:hypothetical protein